VAFIRHPPGVLFVKIILVAAALAALAAPAFAEGQWTAAPAQKASEQGFVAGGAIWNCDDAGCRTTSDTSSADSMSSCRGLAREVGGLTAFQTGAQAFSAERLATCNATVAKTKQLAFQKR
jgi:hypothetical protein